MALESWFARYQESHTHPGNRACHYIGIPMIVASLPIAFINLPTAALLFIGGWALQFLGHWIEGKPPAFFSNPKFLFVGPLYFVAKLRRRDGAPRR